MQLSWANTRERISILQIALPVGIKNSRVVSLPPETVLIYTSREVQESGCLKTVVFGALNLISLHVGAVGYRTTMRRLVVSFLITSGLLLHVSLATRWFMSPKGNVRSLVGKFDKRRLSSESYQATKVWQTFGVLKRDCSQER